MKNKPSLCVVFNGQALLAEPDFAVLRETLPISDAQISQLLAFRAYGAPLLLQEGLDEESASEAAALWRASGFGAEIIEERLSSSLCPLLPLE